MLKDFQLKGQLKSLLKKARNDDVPVEIGEQLKKLRKKEELTQKQLAEKLHISYKQKLGRSS